MADNQKKPLYRYALFWGIGYYGISYHWFTELYPMDFAGFSKPGAIITIALCWIGLTLLQAAWIALLAPLIKFCSHLRERFGEWTAPVFAAAVFTALELCQTKTWLGVPFFRLALTQSGSLQTVQSASVFGSLFISVPYNTCKRSYCFRLHRKRKIKERNILKKER